MIVRFDRAANFGSINANFLGQVGAALHPSQGATVGYAIIVPAILATHLLGGNTSILELIISLVGGVIFLAVGSVALASSSVPTGVLSVITGIIFILDFVLTYKNTSFARPG